MRRVDDCATAGSEGKRAFSITHGVSCTSAMFARRSGLEAIAAADQADQSARRTDCALAQRVVAGDRQTRGDEPAIRNGTPRGAFIRSRIRLGRRGQNGERAHRRQSGISEILHSPHPTPGFGRSRTPPPRTVEPRKPRRARAAGRAVSATEEQKTCPVSRLVRAAGTRASKDWS